MRYFIARRKFLAPVIGTAAITALSMPVMVFADSVNPNGALLDAAQETVDQITANVNGMLPIALGLMASILAITMGIAVFKKLVNKSK